MHAGPFRFTKPQLPKLSEKMSFRVAEEERRQLLELVGPGVTETEAAREVWRAGLAVIRRKSRPRSDVK